MATPAHTAPAPATVLAVHAKPGMRVLFMGAPVTLVAIGPRFDLRLPKHTLRLRDEHGVFVVDHLAAVPLPLA